MENMVAGKESCPAAVRSLRGCETGEAVDRQRPPEPDNPPVLSHPAPVCCTLKERRSNPSVQLVQIPDVKGAPLSEPV
jgi:hypothetical protein